MRVLISALFLASLSLSAAAQQKDCVQGQSIVELGYDGNGVDMQVRQGKSCGRSVNLSSFTPRQFVVVEKPRHGRIEQVGPGVRSWRYVANANYVGSDSFKIRFVGERVDWQTGMSLGTTFVGQHFRVSVIP